MELKYTIELLQHLYEIRYQDCGNLPAYGKSHEAQALQTAISHLETLQKVQEAGGVRKKDIKKEDWNQSVTFGDLLYAENAIIDLIHAELVGKLEGLEGVISEWLKSSEGKEHLSNKIQELILGKKEE